MIFVFISKQRSHRKNVQGNANFFIFKTNKKVWYHIHNHLLFDLLNKYIQPSAEKQCLTRKRSSAELSRAGMGRWWCWIRDAGHFYNCRRPVGGIDREEGVFEMCPLRDWTGFSPSDVLEGFPWDNERSLTGQETFTAYILGITGPPQQLQSNSLQHGNKGVWRKITCLT